jgi:hypothetical protein
VRDRESRYLVTRDASVTARVERESAADVRRRRRGRG